MNMTQLIVGAALGFLVAQCAFHGLKRALPWLLREQVRAHIRKLAPASGGDILHASLKYGALAGAAAALITLGVWATGDYFSSKSARLSASDVESPTAAPVANAPEAPLRTAELAPGLNPDGSSKAAAADASLDAYADPDFKVRHPRGGARLSLKDTLVQRAEAKARAELLAEMRQHQNRSQYDCEAADRAAKYLKAGLDVWGFAAWQVKHFPMDGYEGATLQECQNIKDVVDPSRFDLHGAVAQGE